VTKECGGQDNVLLPPSPPLGTLGWPHTNPWNVWIFLAWQSNAFEMEKNTLIYSEEGLSEPMVLNRKAEEWVREIPCGKDSTQPTIASFETGHSQGKQRPLEAGIVLSLQTATTGSSVLNGKGTGFCQPKWVRNEFSPGASKKALTQFYHGVTIPHLGPPELWDNKVVLFEVTKFGTAAIGTMKSKLTYTHLTI
jgi:hypothetical protein